MRKQARHKGNHPSHYPKKPQFYFTEREKNDPEASRIQRWLELADRLFESNDCDPTPSAAAQTFTARL